MAGTRSLGATIAVAIGKFEPVQVFSRVTDGTTSRWRNLQHENL